MKTAVFLRWCGFLIAALSLLPGCADIFGPDHDPDTNGTETPDELDPGAGAMLVRHGEYLYLIGGLDDDGIPKAAVFAAHITAAGTVEEPWFETAALPVPLAYGVAFGIANFVYVAGGRTSGGALSDEVYYAYVQPEGGRLGFEEEGQWDVNLRSLPYGLSRASWAVHDGHVYLAGGETSDGPNGAILYARLYQDGHMGYWYPSAQSLEGPCSGTAATIDLSADTLRLVVAGGEADGEPCDVLTWFPIGEYGVLLSPFTVQLPSALVDPVVLYDDGSLLVCGGNGGTDPSSVVYRLAGDIWSTVLEPAVPAVGPSYGRAAGTLFYVSQLEPDASGAGLIDRSSRIGETAAFSLSPEAPAVLPGSGLVQRRAHVRLREEPGTVVRYATAPAGEPITDVTASDPEWTPGFRIEASMEMAFKAYSADGKASPLVRRSYQVRPTGFLIDTVRIPLLSEVPEEHAVLAPGWFFFVLDEPGMVTVLWEDADTSDHPEASARVRISVFEPDLFTPVPEALTGAVVLDLESEASPVTMWMNAGSYFVLADELDDSGGTGRFLLSVVYGGQED